ncbi:hypothetical protein [Burkholderia vietnamiensis]|uniref:hypothetical protein n=1 Tax=Burkholderia vietnamiensis TaxID=60552 RepID=UPI00158A9969|nr:hypothetical protein [Burkholderia vietnamiensis]
MTTNENPAAVRVCAISDIQCSRGCGTGACKREQPAAAPIDEFRQIIADARGAIRAANPDLAYEKLGLLLGADESDTAIAARVEAALHAAVEQPAPSPADERAAKKPDAMTKAVKQLADWLLTDPNEGNPLCFAGPPEPFVLGLSRVKMRSIAGDEWTLIAGLQEGWLTAEQRASNFWRIAKLEREEVAREEAVAQYKEIRARAASASATGAEGVLIERLKLLLSGDAAFCKTIVARSAIEQAIAALSRSPAMAGRNEKDADFYGDALVKAEVRSAYQAMIAAAPPLVRYQILTEEGGWLDVPQAYYERFKSDPTLTRVVNPMQPMAAHDESSIEKHFDDYGFYLHGFEEEDREAFFQAAMALIAAPQPAQAHPNVLLEQAACALESMGMKEMARIVRGDKIPNDGSTITQPAQAAMPVLTDAMRAVITNESGAYQSADALYAALCAAAGVERPAQADARVGLTDEQILNAFRDAGIDMNATPNMAYTVRGQQAQLVNAVRALLQGANHAE